MEQSSGARTNDKRRLKGSYQDNTFKKDTRLTIHTYTHFVTQVTCMTLINKPVIEETQGNVRRIRLHQGLLGRRVDGGSVSLAEGDGLRRSGLSPFQGAP